MILVGGRASATRGSGSLGRRSGSSGSVAVGSGGVLSAFQFVFEMTAGCMSN